MNTPRKPWIGTSWKMNKTRDEAVAYLDELGDWLRASALDADIVVFPPYTALPAAGAQLASAGPARPGPAPLLGAQNMHWQPRGAQTGEISAEMLLDCGVHVVELGHYERRSFHGETDRSVNLKAKAAIAVGLRPLICVGDAPEDRRLGVAAETVARQVKIALRGIPPLALRSVVLAYEPGWAIGVGGKGAEPAEVEAMHEVIRTAVRQAHGQEAAEQVRVVYGGSVEPASAGAYAADGAVDGLFVGRAALTVAGFIAIIEQFCTASPATAGQILCQGNQT
jgi:triosephosphate isomerase